MKRRLRKQDSRETCGARRLCKRYLPASALDFAELAHGSDEQIVAFVERHGLLGLEQRAQERIKDWRRYAALAGALLRFTGERATAGEGDEEDCRIICESTIAGRIDRDQLSTHQQTAVTALAVNTWFSRARGHRILEIVDGQLQIRPAASNLFGVLITQIAARTDQMAVCANCKNTFPPKRAVSRGSRQYCIRYLPTRVGLIWKKPFGGTSRSRRRPT